MNHHIRMDVEDFVHEFEWTRPRHGGLVQFAAPIFGMSVKSVERRLYRARKLGIDVQFRPFKAERRDAA